MITQIYSLICVNKSTASYYFHRLRQLIGANHDHSDLFSGEIEIDESSLGGRRKGKRGRGAAGKVPVLGLLKRNGKVYAAMIPDAKTTTLMPIIRDKVKPDSMSIQSVGAATMHWNYQSLSITVLTIVNGLLISIITSRVLRIFGIRLSDR